MASSLDLKVMWRPCWASADDCQPIKGFSHRWPLPRTSQSMRQTDDLWAPDWVAGLEGLKMLCFWRRHVRLTGKQKRRGGGQGRGKRGTYRTVRAWSSRGAPE